MITVMIIVTSVFVVACAWPLLRLPRFAFIETLDLLFPTHDAGCLLALNLKFEPSHRPKILAHHRHPWCFSLRPDEQEPISMSGGRDSRHPHRAHGRRIVSCHLRAEAKGYMLHDLLKGAVLLDWKIKSAVCSYRTCLVHVYRRTGIFFFLKKCFLIFFL